MNYKIDKMSFYVLLEKILSNVYEDDSFKIHVENKDINENIIGTEFKYSIVNDENNKMFESSVKKVYKQKTVDGYVNRNYKTNSTFTIGDDSEINKLLSPYVYKYKVLEIVPLLIETYFEEAKVQDEVNYLNNEELDILTKAAKKYNTGQAQTKIRVLNNIKKL